MTGKACIDYDGNIRLQDGTFIGKATDWEMEESGQYDDCRIECGIGQVGKVTRLLLIRLLAAKRKGILILA